MYNQHLGNYKHFLVEPVTAEVDLINQTTFCNYAKTWAYHGFLPVLWKVEPHMYFVKLYFDATRIKDREELRDLCATYYREKFPALSVQVKCTQIVVFAKKWLVKSQIEQARKLHDLELALLNMLPDDTVVNCNDLGHGYTCNLPNIPRQFTQWNKLVNDGYFEPLYEAICRLEEEQQSKQKAAAITTVPIQLFIKTGGTQPTLWDVKVIDHFFKGNVAKKWAMCDGYLPTLTAYENRVIHFDLITDPRCADIYFISLCKYIGNAYRQSVTLLKDATRFEAAHYIANDIIGFNISGDEKSKFDEYNNRMNASYASLPAKPAWTHNGQIN